MVHTFVLTFDTTASNPYSQSATLLDYRRLGKQRVEAMQILNVLLDYQKIIAHFKLNLLPLDDGNKENYLARDQELLNLRKWYSSLSIRLLEKDGQLIEVDKKYSGEGRLIKLNWGSHPAARMWYGYESSLKMYITAHIFEWVKRGYVNNMIIPGLSLKEMREMKHPWWAQSRLTHLSILASMIRKEIQRREVPWYLPLIKRKDCRLPTNSEEEVKPFLDLGYLWPTNLSLEELAKF